MVSHTDALLFAFFFHLSCGIPDPKKYLTVMVVQSKLDVKIQAFFSVFFYIYLQNRTDARSEVAFRFGGRRNYC